MQFTALLVIFSLLLMVITTSASLDGTDGVFEKRSVDGWEHRRVKRLRNVLAGCVVGAGAAHLTDRSKLAGCGLGGGLSFLANKFLKNRNRGG